jgi:hypothetical protein
MGVRARPNARGGGHHSGRLYAYCGTVEVHRAEGFVLHHVEIDKVPNVVGRTLERWFTFETSDRLRLSVDTAELIPPIVADELLWERVPR